MYAEKEITENQYLLLTPGPLSTSKSVRTAMLRDWCTWDVDYNKLTQHIRKRLTNLATTEKGYTSVLMQGSGSFSVEATLGSCVPAHGRLLILVNGAYGKRMVTIAEKINLDHLALDFGEKDSIDPETIEKCLLLNPEITHVAMVHCETTTGMLNDVEVISSLVKSYDKVFILDAMSSFGGMTMDMDVLGIDFLISSANKCIQGVPGFGFVIANESLLKACAGNARSHALDLYDQWKAMEDHHGKWRFTSPTHVVRAFSQALEELREEGGVEARNLRYRTNQHTLRDGMEKLGFKCLLPKKLQSPIITSFLYPDSPDFHFDVFYSLLKQKGFVIYPGKITSADTFRIGNIGEVYPEDINRLLGAVADSVFW